MQDIICALRSKATADQDRADSLIVIAKRFFPKDNEARDSSYHGRLALSFVDQSLRQIALADRLESLE